MSAMSLSAMSRQVAFLFPNEGLALLLWLAIGASGCSHHASTRADAFAPNACESSSADYEACGDDCLLACDCSFEKVNAAVQAASTGSTVSVPLGTCVWDSMLTIDKAVRLEGAGADSTVLVNGIETDGLDDFFLNLSPASFVDDPYVSVSGFTFDAAGEGGCLRISCTDDEHAWTNFRIHDNVFTNALDEGDSYMCIRTKGNCFGLIDNNQFIDNERDFKVYGNDRQSWEAFPGPDNVGTAHYLFIENNVSVNTGLFTLSSGEGARWGQVGVSIQPDPGRAPARRPRRHPKRRRGCT